MKVYLKCLFCKYNFITIFFALE